MDKSLIKRLREENKLLSEKVRELENRLADNAGNHDVQVQIDESHFKSIFENSTIGLYKTTPDGEILIVNPTAVKLLGYESADELKQRNLEAEGFQPEYSREVFKSILERKGMVKGLESAWHKKDGSRIYVRESARAIRNDEGNIVFYVGTFEDITAKRIAEQKLKESESKYRALFEFAPVAIWEQDYSDIKMELDALKEKHGSKLPEDLLEKDELIARLREKIKILDVNQEGLRMYGAENKSKLLDSVSRIMSSSARIFRRALNCIINGDSYFVDEDLNFDMQGNKLHIMLKWQVAPGQENGYKRVYVTSIDITRLKEVEDKLLAEKEKAEEADNMKSAFLANMSHEIRTPMNSIIGFSELLLERAYSDEEKESFINLIIQNGKSLLNLINDIIDLSKIEAGFLQVEYEKCDIHNLLSVLVKNFKRQLQSSRKDVEIRLNEQLESPVVVTDRFRLNQILVNLIGNAIKFTKKGFIEIGCRLVEEDKFVEFYVKDTGVGIPANELQNIFKRFERLQTDYLKDADGTGLGLYISNQLVNRLGGEVRVKSKEQVGSVFSFTIPNHEAPEQPKAKKETSGRPSCNFHGKTILIAEDTESSYYFLKNLLTSFNARVLWAKNGREAVNTSVNDESIDLILMDIKMPEIDGLEATRLIKARKPDIPIIAETAYAAAGEERKCLKAGCDDYVSKPIDINVLLTKIRHLIEK